MSSKTHDKVQLTWFAINLGMFASLIWHICCVFIRSLNMQGGIYGNNAQNDLFFTTVYVFTAYQKRGAMEACEWMCVCSTCTWTVSYYSQMRKHTHPKKLICETLEVHFTDWLEFPGRFSVTLMESRVTAWVGEVRCCLGSFFFFGDSD